MFKRTLGAAPEPSAHEAAHQNFHSQPPQSQPETSSQSSDTDAMTLTDQQHVSIISNDLTILGSDLKIISEGAIRVDGEIQGEVRGVDVTVGRRGKVIGTVAGDRVMIDGEVAGEIQAGQVTLSSNSRVDGDVHHNSLAIDRGAKFEGRSKRRENVTTLNPETTGHASQSGAIEMPHRSLADA